MPNVLCLHGCNQDLAMFKSIMRDFMKIGEQNGCKFFFTEAKYDHPLGLKTWYKVPLNVKDIGNIEYTSELVEDTMNDIERLIDEHNIDVLLGFSQGGNVVDTYCYYKDDKRIKCAVILSGYSFVDKNRQPKDFPVLNVCSDSDEVVFSKLAPTFLNSTTMKHDKGHKLPTSKPMLRDIISFINQKTN